jgi:hypothetical protein
MQALQDFIIEAKAVTYMSGKRPQPVPTRPGAKDIPYERGRYRYLDSHFGGTDFLGQEVVWQDEIPIWAMNYYGRIIDPARFDGERAGTVIKAGTDRTLPGEALSGWLCLPACPRRICRPVGRRLSQLPRR